MQVEQQYALNKNHRFMFDEGSFGMMKGSRVKVVSKDLAKDKVLIDFGLGFIEWMPTSTLSLFTKVKL